VTTVDDAGAGAPTFAASWRRAVTTVGDRPFLLWQDEERQTRQEWTYAEFDHAVRLVAARLHQLGVRRGDGVHVALGNSPAFVAAWLACVQIGAAIVPSDPRAPAKELVATISRARPALHIGRPGVDIQDELAAAELDVVCLVAEEGPGFGALCAQAPLAEDGHDEPIASDTAGVLYTSGTTSRPKGVRVTQGNYAFTGAVMASASALRAEDRFFVCLPLFHANAQYYCFAAAIHVGASVALMSRFSASRFIDQAERTAATHASLFAAPVRMILERTTGRRSTSYALRHVWFAQNLSADDYSRATELFGCPPRQLYGMTETVAAVLTSHPLEACGDVIGAVTLGCQVRIGDEATGRPVPPGQIGEVLVRGRRGIELFAGYTGDAETTERCFRDDWFRTGDLARMDDAGRFHFAGRSGDRIKVGGENVSLLSVEAALGEHPSVAEVAVIGGFDPVLDEVPVAFVVLRPGQDERSAAPTIQDWCAARLAPSGRPRRLVFVPELPHTSVGKIRKHQLSRLLDDE
jgi:carnitine-CoA ligase